MPYSVISGITPGIGTSDIYSNRVYQTQQYADYATLATSSSGGEVDFVQAFRFSDLGSVSGFQAVFDQYWIYMIDIWLWPSNPPVSGSFGSAARYLTVIDFDDVSSLSAAALLQYSNCTELSANSAVMRSFTPHIALLGQSSGNINVPSTWIDCAAASSVPHYGIKGAIFSTAISFTLNLRARFHIRFRNNI